MRNIYRLCCSECSVQLRERGGRARKKRQSHSRFPFASRFVSAKLNLSLLPRPPVSASDSRQVVSPSTTTAHWYFGSVSFTTRPTHTHTQDLARRPAYDVLDLLQTFITISGFLPVRGAEVNTACTRHRSCRPDIMQPKSNNPLKRLPTWVSISLGVLIGIIVASIFSSDVRYKHSSAFARLTQNCSRIRRCGVVEARRPPPTSTAARDSQ